MGKTVRNLLGIKYCLCQNIGFWNIFFEENSIESVVKMFKNNCQ